MTKEKAKQLLEAIDELKAIRKQIKGYKFVDLKEITIDTDCEIYLKGIIESEKSAEVTIHA